MSHFDKAKKKVRRAAEKTEEEAKEIGGKIRRAGKKGVEKARKVGQETNEKRNDFRLFCLSPRVFTLS